MRSEIHHARSTPRRAALVLGVAAWLAGLGIAFAAVARYGMEPGLASAAPAAWPLADEALPPHVPHAPRVLVFVHPRCPCTNASLDELAAATRDARASITLVPSGPAVTLASSAPRLTDLERLAADHGWAIAHDPTGELARTFGAHTSGHVVAYTADNTLAFSGGVTASRGHRGPNRGAEALRTITTGTAIDRTTTPVFGCPLFDTAPCHPLHADIGCGTAHLDTEHASPQVVNAPGTTP